MCEKDMQGGCKKPFDPSEHRERFIRFYNEASVNDKLAINLRFVAHTMRSRFEASAGQKRILIILSEQEKLTQRELTEQLGIRPGSASEILSKLENAGLIERTPNEEDRRTVDIRLTEAGAELAKESAEKRRKWHEDMFTCLSEQEQENLLSLLEKLHADWEVRFPANHGPHSHHGPHGHHGHGHCCHGPHGHHGHHGRFGPRGECRHGCGKPEHRSEQPQGDE